MDSDTFIVVATAVVLVVALFIVAFPQVVVRNRRLQGIPAGREVLFVRLADSAVAVACVVVLLIRLL
jgi:hypothetical protein